MKTDEQNKTIDTQQTPYLSITNLKKQWQTMTVQATLFAEKGTMLTILGKSGCGKTTLLRMICGVTDIDSGTIVLDGQDITRTKVRGRGIGMVFQDNALFPHLNVQDNVAYGLVSRGMTRKKSRIIASEYLEMFSLAGFEKRSVHTLSGGESQRVSLARTLAVQPKVVMFDEPLSALDPELRVTLRSQIRTYQQELGLTALFVTHDITEALAVSDTIAVMQNGKIITCGTPHSLYTKPPCPAVASFFGAGNIITINNQQFFVPFSECTLAEQASYTTQTAILNAAVKSSTFAGTYTTLECITGNNQTVTLHIPADSPVPAKNTAVCIAVNTAAAVKFAAP